MKHLVRGLALAAVLVSASSPIVHACTQSWCRVDCGSNTQYYYGLTEQQCCAMWTGEYCPSGGYLTVTYNSGCRPLSLSCGW